MNRFKKVILSTSLMVFALTTYAQVSYGDNFLVDQGTVPRSALLNTNLRPGTTAIVKVGEKSVKIIVK